MSQRPVKRLKGSPVAHRIPFDVLCQIAQAGGPKLAINLAMTCKAVKRRIDNRYEVSNMVDITEIANVYGKRLPGVVGRYTSLCIFSDAELPHVPECVRELTVGFHSTATIAMQLPPGLIKLTIKCRLSEGWIFPDSLQSLTLYHDIVLGLQLPPNLKFLTFGPYLTVSQPEFNLPSSLESLVFDGYLPISLDHIKLPNGLKMLQLSKGFNQRLERVRLPESLQELFFISGFNQPLQNVKLPRGLRKLHFGDSFDQSLEEAKLPDDLQELVLGDCFNQPIYQLPQNLRVLTVGQKFNQRLKLPRRLAVWRHSIYSPNLLKSLVIYQRAL